MLPVKVPEFVRHWLSAVAIKFVVELEDELLIVLVQVAYALDTKPLITNEIINVDIVYFSDHLKLFNLSTFAFDSSFNIFIFSNFFGTINNAYIK